MFQNLGNNETIYVIDKTSVPVLKVGQVVSKSTPTAVNQTQTNGLLMGLNQQFELTIRARVDGNEGDFPHLLTTESVHDYGNMVVADSREAVLSEIDKIRMRAQGELDRKEFNEQTVESCEEMSKTVNPAYAKEKERDEAIEMLNSRLDRMKDSMESSMEKILKLLNKKS